MTPVSEAPTLSPTQPFRPQTVATVHPDMLTVLDALISVMQGFQITETEELYVLKVEQQHHEETAPTVVDELSMTDEQWGELHHDDEATASSQRVFNCCRTVTELETIVVDSQAIPMVVDLTHEDDGPPEQREESTQAPPDNAEPEGILTIETILGNHQLAQCVVCGLMEPGNPAMLHRCIFQHKTFNFVEAHGTVDINSKQIRVVQWDNTRNHARPHALR